MLIFCLAFLAQSACGGSAPGANSPAPSTADTPAEVADPAFSPLVPGSRVSLTLPPGAERFSRAYAFRRLDPLIAIVVTETTAPSGHESEMLRGIAVGAKEFGELEEAMRGDTRELRAQGTVNENPASMLVLARDGAIATIMVVYVPETRPEAEAVLESVRLNATAALDPLAIHALSLTPRGPLEVLDTLHQPIMLGNPSRSTPGPLTEPVAFISVVPHNEGNDISDEALGGLLGSAIGDLGPDMQSAKVGNLDLNGSPATEFVAAGMKDGQPIAIYAYIVRDGGAVLISVGYVAQSVADAKMPDVVETLRSLELHPYR